MENAHYLDLYLVNETPGDSPTHGLVNRADNNLRAASSDTDRRSVRGNVSRLGRIAHEFVGVQDSAM
jgi:hypothetical protein